MNRAIEGNIMMASGITTLSATPTDKHPLSSDHPSHNSDSEASSSQSRSDSLSTLGPEPNPSPSPLPPNSSTIQVTPLTSPPDPSAIKVSPLPPDPSAIKVTPLTPSTSPWDYCVRFSKDGESKALTLNPKQAALRNEAQKLTEQLIPNASFTIFTGKHDKVIVAAYTTDQNGGQVLFDLPENHPDYAKLAKIKDVVRELHLSVSGRPTSNQPFETLDPLWKDSKPDGFARNGGILRILTFIQANGLNISEHTVRAKIQAAAAWIQTVGKGIDTLIKNKTVEELALTPQRPTQPLDPAQRIQLAKVRADLKKLQEMKRKIEECDVSRESSTILNIVLSLNNELNNQEMARHTQEAIYTILQEKEATRLKDQSPWYKAHLPPRLPESAILKAAHSGAALPLYHVENSYIRWCDEHGRMMTTDSIPRLVVTGVLSALQHRNDPNSIEPEIEFGGAPILESDQPSIRALFNKAAEAAIKAYDFEMERQRVEAAGNAADIEMQVLGENP